MVTIDIGAETLAMATITNFLTELIFPAGSIIIGKHT